MKRKTRLLSLISALAIGATFAFTACKDSNVGEHDHVWGEPVVTVSTCHSEGLRTYYCNVEGCTQEKTEPIAMIAHSWNSGEVTKESKCNEEGVKTYTCTADGCGKTKVEPLEKTDHRFDDGKITKAPDFLSKGIKTLTCLDCKTEKQKSVEAHADFSEQFYTTLTEGNNWLYGYANTYDAQTGAVDFVRIEQAKSGVWKSEQVEIGKGYVYSGDNAVIAYVFNQAMPEGVQTNVAVSFTGEESGTCLNAYLIINGECIGLNKDNAKDWSYQTEEALYIAQGDIIYLVLENNGEGKAGGSLTLTLTAPCIHGWDEGTVTEEATCTTEGVIEYNCHYCEEIRQVKTEKLEHNYVTHLEDVDKAATCKEDGYTVWQCASCEETEQRTISKDTVSHTYEYTKVDVNEHKAVCSVCGDENFEEHAWKESDRQPAIGSEDGYVNYECELCGETKHEILPSEHEHAWDEGKVTVKPTLTSTGTKTFTCKVCDETKTEDVAAVNSANFNADFSTEANPNAGWSYGYVNYQFGDKEDFTFIAADGHSKDGETALGWTAFVKEGEETKVNVDIRGDYVQAANGFATIAYHFSAAVTVNVSFKFTGNGPEGNSEEQGKFNIRIGIKHSDGTMDNNPEFHSGEAVTVNKTIEFAEGDTIYFIIEHAPKGWDAGRPEITITKGDHVHEFTGDWLVGEHGHYHKCKLCDETDDEVEHTHNKENEDKRVPATCHSDGTRYLVCECGHETTQAITERPDHDFTGEWQIGVNGHYHICLNEGCNTVDDEVEHTHNKENEDNRVPATCHSDGKKYMVCECGDETEVAITVRPQHDFTGEWINTSAEGHYHKCKNCDATDTPAAHEWEVVEVIKPATNDEDGEEKVKCTECKREDTRIIPALNHKKGTEYGKDDNGHWFKCSEHTDCGVKFEEADQHTFDTELTDESKAATCEEDGYTVWQCECGATEQRTITKDPAYHNLSDWKVDETAGTHYKECSICGNRVDEAEHDSENHTYTKPTLFSDGSRVFDCDTCGMHVSEVLPACAADFGKDFELNESGTFSGWEVGVVNYDFDAENFVFTKITALNGDENAYNNADPWIEINSGWMAANGMMGFAYHFDGMAKVGIEFNLHCLADDGKYSLRWAVKNASGEIKINNGKADWGGDGHDIAFKQIISVEEGDVLYLLLNKEGNGDQSNFDITLTRYQKLADFGEDFKLNESGKFSGWEVGYADYHFDGTETFDYTQITALNENEDAYHSNDPWIDIIGGWMASRGMVAVVYNFEEAAGVKFDFKITCKENGECSVRWAVKDKDGNIKDGGKAKWGGSGNSVTLSEELTVEEGDVLYVLIGHEGGADNSDQKDFTLTIDKKVL